LIELLVVIATIALLAGIVLVSLKGVIEKARIVKVLKFSQSIQNVLGADVVGIWTFDDQTNPTKDTSGYGNDGAISGAVFTDDTPHKFVGAGTAQGKYALYFDGVDDYVSVNVGNYTILSNDSEIRIDSYNWVLKKSIYLSQTPSQNLTIYFEFHGDNTCDEYAQIYRNGVAVGALRNIGADTNGAWNSFTEVIGGWNNGDSLELWARNSCAFGGGLRNFRVLVQFSTIELWEKSSSDTRWYHLVNTPDALYINGAVGSGRVVPLAYQEGGAVIGRDSSGDYFNGIIDKVRIYNRALESAEIQKHYAEGLERHQSSRK
jgi:type II secretory pathway pseudopilin PulG